MVTGNNFTALSVRQIGAGSSGRTPGFSAWRRALAGALAAFLGRTGNQASGGTGAFYGVLGQPNVVKL
jgi:hypothetical protein